MTDEIINLLDQLADIESQIDVLNIERAMARKAAIPAEVQAELDAIDAEFETQKSAAEANIVDLRVRLDPLVIAHGASVKGKRMQAVFTKGRITWDAKALDGYAINHPELFAFRAEGEPSVRLRSR